MPSGWVERCGREVAALSRGAKMSIAVAADAVAVPILLMLAVVLRRASFTEALQLPIYLYIAACAVAVSSFWAIGMYRAGMRCSPWPPGLVMRHSSWTTRTWSCTCSKT